MSSSLPQTIPETPKTNWATQYIIESNKNLSSEVIELRKTSLEQTEQINSLEDENDRDSQRMTYMRGILKNFIEMDKIRIKNVHIDKQVEKEINVVIRAESLLQVKSNIFICFLGLLIICMQLIDIQYRNSIFLESYTIIISKTIIITTVVSTLTVYRFYQKPTKFLVKTLIRQKHLNNIEIKKIFDAQDYLHEYIDNV